MKSDYDFRCPIGMHIVYIEGTLKNIAELRDSKYVAYWTRSMMSELQGHAPILIFFSDENIFPKE